ncbi:MAG: Holliday junction resolvase-like protein [Candidatus Undinarchaeales archaeon]
MSWLILIIGAIIGFAVGYFVFRTLVAERVKAEMESDFKDRIPKIRKETLKRSRATLKGRITEQLAAFLPGFEYESADARFIGSPIDLIIFDGYTNKSDDIEVVFMDVKKGTKARLTKMQKKIKKAIENNKVKWETLRLKDKTDILEEEDKKINEIMKDFEEEDK